MADLTELIGDLVAANRILAHEGVVDAFGHVSVRHPEREDRFFLSRSISPELVEAADILEFDMEGEPVAPGDAKPYLERFIHAAIYAARPEVQSVVHSHSRSVVPYSVTDVKLRPVMHSCACIGHEVPTWNSQDRFGDTDLLVSDMEMGRDLARIMGNRPSVLMRGHGSTVCGGSIREAVYTAVYLEVNATLQSTALQLGNPTFLTKGEVDTINERAVEGMAAGVGFNRAWDYWCRRAGIAA